MASLTFYPHKETDGKTLILIVFTFNHERLRLSSGVSVPTKAWDSESQKAKPMKDYAEENKKLREISKFLFDRYDFLFSSDKKLTREEVKRLALELKNDYRVFTGRQDEEVKVQATLISYIQIFQERYKNKFNPDHLAHYNALKGHLEKFQEKKRFRVNFDTIGKDFYIKFTDYLQEEKLKVNTIGAHIKRVKRIMDEAFEDKLHANQDHKKREFKVMQEDADTVYLTETELKHLYQMEIENASKKRIRDIFILNCYTGLRHSDWHKVRKDNIHDGKLYVKTQKTNEPVIIPVKPIVIEILDRYENLSIPTLQKTNEAIRWIGEFAKEKKVGNGDLKKWLAIRTHTARRSFATNAYLAGIPMRDIMQITGHRTTESFLKYIRVTKLETAEKLKDHPFFQ